MSEIFTVLLLIVLGGVFLLATYLSYKKEWKAGAYISLVVAAFFFVMALPATRDFMRSTAWVAFVTSLEATGQGLIRLNNTINDIRAGMEAEQKKREAQQAELDHVQQETRQMQDSVRIAQETLQKQQEKIADINQLLKAFYEAGTTKHYSSESDSDILIIISHESNRVTLYALLPDSPIPQTLELQYYISVQPRNSYFVDGNLVTFRWGQSESSLRDKPLAFTYVPDPTSEPKFEKLERRGHRVYADGKPLLYGYIENDPVFKKLVETKGSHAEITLEELQAALEAELGSKAPIRE